MDFSASPTLALGVFGASLLGSVHCAAMCGGFAAFCGGDAERAGHGGASRLTGQLGYHGGRLVAYATLGAVAGALGSGFDRVGRLAGVQRAAGYLAGALLVLWGLAMLAHALDVRFLRVPGRTGRSGVSDRAARVIGGVLLHFRERSPGVRASLLGLLTGLIPCGWLYAFVVAAGGTGSAWRGAAFLVLFWAGTVPALVTVAMSMRRATGALGRRLPVVSALLVIGFGLAALGGRLASARDHGAHVAVSPAAGHSTHDSLATPAIPGPPHDH